MRTKYYLLNTGAEIYTSYVDIQSVLNFLSRARRIRNFVLIAQRGPRAKVWELEKVESLLDVQKEALEFQNS